MIPPFIGYSSRPQTAHQMDRHKKRYRPLAQYNSRLLRQMFETELDSEPMEYSLHFERYPEFQAGGYKCPVVEAAIAVTSPSGERISTIEPIPVEKPTHQWYHNALTTLLAFLYSAVILDRNEGREWVERPDVEPLERDPENPNIARGSSGTFVYNPKEDQWELFQKMSDLVYRGEGMS